MHEDFLFWAMLTACVICMLLIVINSGVLLSMTRRKKR